MSMCLCGCVHLQEELHRQDVSTFVSEQGHHYHSLKQVSPSDNVGEVMGRNWGMLVPPPSSSLLVSVCVWYRVLTLSSPYAVVVLSLCVSGTEQPMILGFPTRMVYLTHDA